MPLRRLNIREYNNTVRDLLGVTSNPANAFPLDKQDQFAYNTAGIVSTTDLDMLKDAAESSAAGVSAKATTLAPCDNGANEDDCATSFINDFGSRAFRRPVAADELTRLMDLYKTGRTTLMLSYADGIQLLVEGMLQSPAFLYHWEIGNDKPITDKNGAIQLNGYEVASRLSYFIWGSMPDADLFAAAKGNQLSTADQVTAQATRLLADPKAKSTIEEFTTEWLSLTNITDRPKDPMYYPEYNDALKAAMLAEMQQFASNTIIAADGKFSSLLTSTTSFVNQALGTLYGAQGGGGTNMAQVTLPGDQRAGLLTRAALMVITSNTNASSPIKRGHLVYSQVMCGTNFPPPNNVPPPAPPTDAGTTRQHFEAHDMNACTGVCHKTMDPIGFAFEEYDGIGKFRTTEKNLPIDSSSSTTLDGKTVAYKNANEFSAALAKSDQVNRCFATNLLRFAFKRTETADDQYSLNQMTTALEKASSVKDLILAEVGSRTFRFRSPGTGEDLQ